MKRLLILIMLLLPIAGSSQVRTFYLTGDTVVTIDNRAVLDYFKRMAPFIKSPTSIVLADKLVFRKGLPIQLIGGYPVQFTDKGIEVKPRMINATALNLKTGATLTANFADNDGDFRKPVNPKPVPIRETEVVVVKSLEGE